MNAAISAYPWPWNLIAYLILGVGWLATAIFLGMYTRQEPWSQSETGRHLVSFSGSVFSFFTLYLVLALFPNLPGKGAVRFVLLIGIVVVSVWRLKMYLRYRRSERDKRRPTL